MAEKNLDDEKFDLYDQANREDRFGPVRDFVGSSFFQDGEKLLKILPTDPRAITEIKTGNLNISTGDNIDLLQDYNMALMYLGACLTVLNTIPNKKIKTTISSDTYELAGKISKFIK